MTWCHDQRMAWIAESVYVFGFINRDHIMRKFRVSQPQASKDLKDFQRLCPGVLQYNVSTKRYEPAVDLSQGPASQTSATAPHVR